MYVGGGRITAKQVRKAARILKRNAIKPDGHGDIHFKWNGLYWDAVNPPGMIKIILVALMLMFCVGVVSAETLYESLTPTEIEKIVDKDWEYQLAKAAGNVVTTDGSIGDLLYRADEYGNLIITPLTLKDIEWDVDVATQSDIDVIMELMAELEERVKKSERRLMEAEDEIRYLMGEKPMILGGNTYRKYYEGAGAFQMD